MLFACASAVITSVWVAVCAAAPEFIWQGLGVVFAQVNLADLLSALLIGLILAFFVEPLMERMRDLLQRRQHKPSAHRRPGNALFAASLGLAFALASICLHDAMTAFVSGRGMESPEHQAGLTAGIALTFAWAMGPFAVTLAWLSVRHRRLAVPLTIVAGISPCITGWLFSWSQHAVITTTVPGLAILGFGYRQVRRGDFPRCAGTVACVAAIWLAIALLFDATLGFFHVQQLKLYDASRFWTDARFYFGWMLGLMLVPSPNLHAPRASGAMPD
jgi:hypothetical protein